MAAFTLMMVALAHSREKRGCSWIDDNLWIAQDDEGLSRIEHSSDRGNPHSLRGSGPNDLTAPQTHALLQDREGNIWVGTERGVDRYQKTSFVHFRSTQLRFSPSLVAGDDGSVWINSHGSSLMKVVNGVTTPVGAHVNTGPLTKKKRRHLLHRSHEL